MADKPVAYGERAFVDGVFGRNGKKKKPKSSTKPTTRRHETPYHLLDPRREDNIIRRFDPQRPDNNIRTLFGALDANWYRKPKSNTAPGRKVMGRVTRPEPTQPPMQVVPDNTQYSKTLEDFLAQAREIVNSSASSQLGLLGNQEAALKRNAAEIQGKIAGGYSGLSSFIDGRNPVIKENYQSGVEGVADAASRAQEAITSGTATAQAQQQAILNRLGIQDANIPIANDGQTLEAQMAANVADSAGRAQNAETQLNSNMATSLDFNTSAGTAAALEGQGQQDRISRDLMTRLAELADQRTQIQSQTQQSPYELAMMLRNDDYNIWEGNYGRRYQVDQDAMSNAMAMQEAQAKANQMPELNSTTWSALGPLGQAEYALTQSGVPPQEASAILATIEQEGGRHATAASFIQRLQQLAIERGLEPISTQNAARIYYNYGS